MGETSYRIGSFIPHLHYTLPCQDVDRLSVLLNRTTPKHNIIAINLHGGVLKPGNDDEVP